MQDLVQLLMAMCGGIAIALFIYAFFKQEDE